MKWPMLIAGCLSVALSANGAAAQARDAPSTLAPGMVISGAHLAPGIAAPGSLPKPLGPFTPLRAPIAVAAYGQDIYVVDAAMGALLRVDPHLNRMVQFTGRPFQPGTKLALDADLSLYMLDVVNRRIQRFSRDGRLLSTFATDATVASLTGFALQGGRLLAVDGLNTQLVSFRPLGVFQILPVRAEPRYTVMSLGAIALARDTIFAIDPRCACIVRMDLEGRVLSTFAHRQVRQPQNIVVDRHGRLLVSDNADRTIKVFDVERLVESIPLSRFGLSEATDMYLDDGSLYVADAPGSRVAMLRVQPSRQKDEPGKR